MFLIRHMTEQPLAALWPGDQTVHLVQQGLSLIDELLGCAFVNLLTVKLSVVQHPDHLRGDCIALTGDGAELVLKISIGRIVRNSARERACGNHELIFRNWK